jgi:hypothetical protein
VASPSVEAWLLVGRGAGVNGTHTDFEGDIYCVTRWSKLGIRYAGVPVDTLLVPGGVMEAATHGWPSAAAATRRVCRLRMFAAGRPGSRGSPKGLSVPAEHDGPAPLLVPHLSIWKSAEQIKRLRLLDHDQAASGKRTATTGTVMLGDRDPRRDPAAKLFRLSLPEWRARLPGQCYTLCLVAPGGYQAIRSHSIASSVLDAGEIELTVNCLWTAGRPRSARGGGDR